MSNILSAGRSSPDMSLEEKTKLEVSRWYKHFYNWSRGLVPKDDSHVRLVFDALCADFRVVLTNGNMVARDRSVFNRLNLFGRSRDDSSIDTPDSQWC